MPSTFLTLPAIALALAGALSAQPADPIGAKVGGLRGRVVVPATPEHPFPSEGTTLRLRDGRLIHVFNWRAAPKDNQPWHPHYVPTVLGAVYSTDEGASWTPPETYLKSASRTASHPGLVYMANGELGLSYNRIDSDTRAFKVFRYSADEGRTWSEEIVISPTEAYWTSAHDRLIVHSSGRLLQPLHTKTTPRTRASTVAWSDDHGRTWKLGQQRLTVTEEGAGKGFTGDRGFHEVSIAERADRSLFMIGRTHTGFLYSSSSSDRGETWSEPARTDLVSPAAPARVHRLPNSPDLLLIWTSCCVDPKHWAMGPRFTLTAAISPDGGATWPYRRDIESVVPLGPRENGVAYTSIYVDRGTAFLAYHVALGEGAASKGPQYGVALPLSWFYIGRDYPEPAFPASGLRGQLIAPATGQVARNGEGSTIRLKDGTLLHAVTRHFRPADPKKYPNADFWPAAVAFSRSRDNGDSWSPPEIAFRSTTGENAMQPSFARLANGEIGLSYSRLDAVDKATKVFRYSADEGRNWSEEVLISPREGYWTSAHDRMVVHSSGRILHPLHTKIDKQLIGRATHVAWSDDQGRSWKLGRQALTVKDAMPTTKRRFIEYGFHEVSLAELAGGALAMVGRTNAGWLYRSESRDRGETWTEPERLAVMSPAAPARIQRVPGSADLLMVWNRCCIDPDHSLLGQRLTLAASISADGGRNWQWQRDIESVAPGVRVEYPAVNIWEREVFLTYRVQRAGNLQEYFLKLPLDWFYALRDHHKPDAAVGGRR